MIEKKYLTFDELSERWNCEKRDIHYLIANGDLVPSLVWNDMAGYCVWEPDTESDGQLFLVEGRGDNFESQETRLQCWVYLRLPTVNGPYDRYYFSYATIDEHPKMEEFVKYVWYRLIQSLDYGQATARVDASWIECNAAFMMNQIRDCEFWHSSLIKEKTPITESVAVQLPAIDRAHVSDKLAKMNQAAAKFWGNADRDDRGTHPDNATVTAWLAQQGFSATLADKAATIIRPEWVPTGRKPEE